MELRKDTDWLPLIGGHREEPSNEIYLEHSAADDEEALESRPPQDQVVVGLDQIFVPGLPKSGHGLVGEYFDQVKVDL